MPKWDVSPQGSVAWLKARNGCLTASRMADAMAFLKGGKETEARRKLKLEVIAERMTDTMQERFVTNAMQWGTDTEPLARSEYEIIMETLVTECGFALHDEIEFLGASPDGLIGHDGLIEIKCPNSTTHLEWKLAGGVPDKHVPQILLQLAVTGREWCDFMSYDPRLPEGVNLHIARFRPTKDEIKAVEQLAVNFLTEVDDLWEKLMFGEGSTF